MQIKYYRFYFLFTILFFSGHSFAQKKLKGKVISVKDGDTIEILVEKASFRIRLNDIDCPESAQDFGTAAKKFTSSYCFGKTVTVQYSKKDKYGRILGHVILPDLKNLNKELVKNGLAWKFNYSQNKEIAALELAARKNKCGLWKGNNPIPPWEFRKQNSRKKSKK
jgi:micrococcal nuclease